MPCGIRSYRKLFARPHCHFQLQGKARHASSVLSPSDNQVLTLSQEFLYLHTNRLLPIGIAANGLPVEENFGPVVASKDHLGFLDSLGQLEGLREKMRMVAAVSFGAPNPLGGGLCRE